MTGRWQAHGCDPGLHDFEPGDLIAQKLDTGLPSLLESGIMSEVVKAVTSYSIRVWSDSNLGTDFFFQRRFSTSSRKSWIYEFEILQEKL